MILYSKKILLFIEEIKRMVGQVLSKEMGLKISKERFCNRTETVSYPIKIVVYNNKSVIGYFDPEFYEMGFHECLMQVSKDQLHNVIRHEIAHYMTFIEYGAIFEPHGEEFRSFCKQMKWGEEIYAASINLDQPLEIEHSSVLRKVEKLIALGASSNEYEAEQAMIKSQELLLKHNIDATYLGSDNEEKICLKRVVREKKETAKMRSIGKILETFFVSTVYHRSKDFTYLEILGNSTNVEIAGYVADFLQLELDQLWIRAKKEARLKGAVAKNSFFLGVAKGYCNKIEALKQNYSADVTKAILVIEKQLVLAREIAYPSLSQVKRSCGYCQESSLFGQKIGRGLTINPAINQSGNSYGATISYKN